MNRIRIFIQSKRPAIVFLILLCGILRAGAFLLAEDQAESSAEVDLIKRAQECHDRHEYDMAIEFLKKAIAINPGSDEAHNNLGTVYFSRGDFKEAGCRFEKALSLNPRYSRALYNRGLVFKKQADVWSVFKCYRQLRELDGERARRLLPEPVIVSLGVIVLPVIMRYLMVMSVVLIITMIVLYQKSRKPIYQYYLISYIALTLGLYLVFELWSFPKTSGLPWVLRIAIYLLLGLSLYNLRIIFRMRKEEARKRMSR